MASLPVWVGGHTALRHQEHQGSRDKMSLFPPSRPTFC